MITTKLAFREIGGFNEELVTGEDYDLCHRYLNNRMIVVQRSDFACYHLGNPKNIRRFFFREKWHGQGDYYDLSTFAKSPIAILGVVYAALHVAIISTAILGRWNVSLGITAVLIALNIALTYYRFKNIKNFFSRQVLTYLYFMARFASISYLWSR
jgi:GT2 family glycosyltransferase